MRFTFLDSYVTFSISHDSMFASLRFLFLRRDYQMGMSGMSDKLKPHA